MNTIKLILFLCLALIGVSAEAYAPSNLNFTTTTETHRRSEVSDLTSHNDDNRYSIGFEGEYEETRIEEIATTLRGSQLNFGGDLSITSGNDISVAASTITTGQDLRLQAARDLNLLSDDQVMTLIESEIEGKASVTVGVGNATTTFIRPCAITKRPRKNAKMPNRP